jgi:diguanylate cyclase (GGDEF)-like protein/PAS domain S-box-containing protein
MAGQPGRQWLDTARQLASAGLLAFAPAAMALAASAVPPPSAAPAASAARAAPAAIADELPRHELETLALVDPMHVLRVIPDRLRVAKAAGDWNEQALLQLARANACRVLANWPCQRTASTAARMAAALAGSPVLQVRGLIAEARAYISMQEFNQGERLLGAAEHILEKSPSPELSADIDLAYSSLSYVLDKPELAADYAARGLHALGLRPALQIRVRLLRNQANALTRLGRVDEARKAIGKGIELLGPLRDPKLSGELYLEDARVAQATGDNAAQVASGERVLAAAHELTNNQLVGLGHETLGLAARARGDRVTARRELEMALASFRALNLDREERRVLRVLAHEQLQDGKAPDTAFARRLLALEEGLDESDYQLAGEDLEARMKYEQQKFDVQRLETEVALNAQRERALAYQQRFAIVVAAASLLLFAIMTGFLFAQRRWSARLQQAIDGMRESERRVSRSEVRMRAIADNMPALIAHIDLNERYLFVNAMGANIFGIDIDDMVGRTVREVRGEEIYTVMKPHIDAALRGETVSFEGETVVEGIRYHYQSSFVPDRDAEGRVQGLYALTFDITRLKQAEEALERLARIDSLTGVANRRQFEEQLAAALARARRQHEGIALLAIDVDHFKNINDNHGHPIGDSVLVEVAGRLLACVRAGDLVARLGGVEFMVLLVNPEPDSAEIIAQHVMSAIREPVELGPHMELPIGTSIGVAYSSSAIDGQVLMSLADRALYRAKAAGRNCWRSASAEEVAASA